MCFSRYFCLVCKPELERCQAAIGFGELLIHARREVNGKVAQDSQDLSILLANRKYDDLVDAACAAIGRLITVNRAVISVEQFLPQIVEKLKTGKIRYGQEDVFACFHVLLNQQNKVLLTMLHSLIFIGVRTIGSCWNDSERILIQLLFIAHDTAKCI